MSLDLESHWERLCDDGSDLDVNAPCSRSVSTCCALRLSSSPAFGDNAVDAHSTPPPVQETVLVVFGGKTSTTRLKRWIDDQQTFCSIRSNDTTTVQSWSTPCADGVHSFLGDIRCFAVSARRWLPVAAMMEDPHHGVPAPRAYHSVTPLASASHGSSSPSTLGAMLITGGKTSHRALRGAGPVASDVILGDVWVLHASLDAASLDAVRLRWECLVAHDSAASYAQCYHATAAVRIPRALWHRTRSVVSGWAAHSSTAAVSGLPFSNPLMEPNDDDLGYSDGDDTTVVVSHGGNDGVLLDDTIRGFDVHTRTWHCLPCFPEPYPSSSETERYDDDQVGAERNASGSNWCPECFVRHDFCCHRSTTIRPFLLRRRLRSQTMVPRSEAFRRNSFHVPPRDGHTMVAALPVMARLQPLSVPSWSNRMVAQPVRTSSNVRGCNRCSEATGDAATAWPGVEVLIFGGEVALTRYNTLLALRIEPVCLQGPARVDGGIMAAATCANNAIAAVLWRVVTGGVECTATAADPSPPRDVVRESSPSVPRGPSGSDPHRVAASVAPGDAGSERLSTPTLIREGDPSRRPLFREGELHSGGSFAALSTSPELSDFDTAHQNSGRTCTCPTDVNQFGCDVTTCGARPSMALASSALDTDICTSPSALPPVVVVTASAERDVTDAAFQAGAVPNDGCAPAVTKNKMLATSVVRWAPRHRSFHAAWVSGATGLVIFGGVAQRCFPSPAEYFDRVAATWHPLIPVACGGVRGAVENSFGRHHRRLGDASFSCLEVHAVPVPRCAAASTQIMAAAASSLDGTRLAVITECRGCGAPLHELFLFGGETEAGELLRDVWKFTIHYQGCTEAARVSSSCAHDHDGAFVDALAFPCSGQTRRAIDGAVELTPPPKEKRTRRQTGLVPAPTDPSLHPLWSGSSSHASALLTSPSTTVSLLPLKGLVGLFVKEHFPEVLTTGRQNARAK